MQESVAREEMTMKFKKIISVLLCAVMVLSVCCVPAFAAETETYVPAYNTDTPVVIVHGMSQNNTYVLNEDGSWQTDENGDYITGWPLEIDVMALVKEALPELLLSVFTRRDMGLTEAMKKGTYEALFAIHKDNQGNYLTPVEVPCYEYPMSEMTEELKEYYYNFLPLQGLADIVGEENIYYFGYDSIGDVQYETEKLNRYIHEVVLPQSGADSVRICPISLGGTIAVNYLERYPEDYSLIERMVFVIPALNGSTIIGDLIVGDLSILNDDDMLYNKFLVSLLGDSWLSYLLNIVLRILPTDVLKSALGGLAESLVETAIVPTTILWALCPAEYYEEGRAKWLESGEYPEILEKVDAYAQARANFADNLAALQATGCKVFDIVCYGGEMFPLCADYDTTNGDGIVHAASASMGATFANPGEAFADDYTAVGTYCSDPAHNHISPDRNADATTGLLPCRTWYIKNQAHEKLPYNDVALKLAFDIMCDENIEDVYSRPDVYPQFNEGRLTNNVKLYLAAWEEADKSKLSDSKVAAVEAAVAEVNAQLDETVVNTAEWLAAEEALRVALVNAGVIEDTEPGAIENFFTRFMASVNGTVNSVYSFFTKAE